MRSGMTAPSPAALRMRRSRERRRQGGVMVRLEVASGATADLVALGWILEPDRGDKDALARALAGLINQAIAMRVTPSTTESEDVCFAPLRVTPGQIAVGFDESAGLSLKVGTASKRDVAQGLGLGLVELGEVLGVADDAAKNVEDKPPEAQPGDRVDTPDVAVEPAELSPLEPPQAQPWAEPAHPFGVDQARLWGPRLTLWQRRKIWSPGWGPRPDQDGCLAPDDLL
jgi:hypothetical protein